MCLNEKPREEHVRDVNGLSAIKTLASQFLEAIKIWENSSEELMKEKMEGEKVAYENTHLQTNSRKRCNGANNIHRYSEERNTSKGLNQTELQLQQVLDAELVAMQNQIEGS